MRYVMVIDLNRCIGCHACSVMCKAENNLPNDIWWNRVLTVGGDSMETAALIDGRNRMTYMPVNCQHCENPACAKACPVGATYKRAEDGVVIQDYDRCIGCRMCMVACPYTARSFNWKKPEYYQEFALGDSDIIPHQYNVVEKCTFCVHRLARGEKPACISVCTVQARIFGDLDDPESDVSKALQGRQYIRLLEDKGTGPNVYYLK